MKVPKILLFSLVWCTVFSVTKITGASSLLVIMQQGKKIGDYINLPVLDLSEMVVDIKTVHKKKGRKVTTSSQPIFLGNLHGWPEFIKECNMSGVSILNLSINYLSDLHPAIAFLPLKSLYLQDNLFKSVPPEVSQLTDLVILDLSSNQLRALPDSIGSLTKLKKLYCQNNHLYTIPSTLLNCTELNELRLDHNDFSDGFPSFIFDGSMVSLMIVSIESSGSFHAYGITSPKITHVTYDTYTIKAPNKPVRATYYGPTHPNNTEPGSRYALLIIQKDEVKEPYYPIGSAEADMEFESILKKINANWLEEDILDYLNQSTSSDEEDDESSTSSEYSSATSSSVPLSFIPQQESKMHQSDGAIDYSCPTQTTACSSSSSSAPCTTYTRATPKYRETQQAEKHLISSPAGDLPQKPPRPVGMMPRTKHCNGVGGLPTLQDLYRPTESGFSSSQSCHNLRALCGPDPSPASSSTGSPREPATDSPRDLEVSTALSTSLNSEPSSPELTPFSRSISCDDLSNLTKTLIHETSYETPRDHPL